MKNYAYQFFLNLPFGETMAEQRRSSFNNVYKFNGKELDPETGLYYYGARYYNPRVSNWLSVDPIALWQPVQEVEHYVEGQHNGGYFNPKNMSVYGYTYQNPIRYIDPNGKQVDVVYNKGTREIRVSDRRFMKNKQGAVLPIKYVGVSDYKINGRDSNGNRLSYYQVLVVKGPFTGGIVDGNGNVTRNTNRPQNPITNGSYDILDNFADTDPKHKGWFRLDKMDGKRYNDRDDANGRDGYRWHLGTESWGCVTFDTNNEEMQEAYQLISDIFKNTNTEIVPEKRGIQGWNPFSFLRWYGTLTVEGEDNIPEQEKE